MGRWQPNARGRLEQAALELYGERGFENTTVAEIAERAGLTERTFFRHFADKREVLFGGAGQLDELLTSAVAAAPDGRDADPGRRRGPGGGRRRPRRAPRLRPPAPADHRGEPELRERELVKLASWAVVLADALRERGVDPRPRRSSPRSGSPSSGSRSSVGSTTPTLLGLSDLLRASLDELKALATSDGRAALAPIRP